MVQPDDQRDDQRDEVLDELLDVIEPTGEYVTTLPRSIVHAEGRWHQVFHCLIVRSGGTGPATALLQRRRRAARAFPGLLDLTVTGHLAAGEAPADGVREIREELGLEVDPGRLVPVGRRLIADDGGEGRNREIAHQFLLIDDTPLTELVIDPHEVAGFVELSIGDLVQLLDGSSASVAALEAEPGGRVLTTTCTLADLVPAGDGSWLAIAHAAAGVVAGEAR